MKVLRAIAAILCGFMFIVSQCSALIILPGHCPDIKPMTDFKVAKYMGRWYVGDKYFVLSEVGDKCITADYKLEEDGAISVVKTQIGELSGARSEFKDEGRQISGSNEGKMFFRFSFIPLDVAIPYWVVDTDYTSYAVLYSCTQLGWFHTRNAWILTRERIPPQAVINNAYIAVDNHGISRSCFVSTNQEDCPKENDTNISQTIF